MFEALQRLDGRLWERYLTLKKNVENASNSFFDAYLDLSEQFCGISQGTPHCRSAPPAANCCVTQRY